MTMITTKSSKPFSFISKRIKKGINIKKGQVAPSTKTCNVRFAPSDNDLIKVIAIPNMETYCDNDVNNNDNNDNNVDGSTAWYTVEDYKRFKDDYTMQSKLLSDYLQTNNAEAQTTASIAIPDVYHGVRTKENVQQYRKLQKKCFRIVMREQFIQREAAKDDGDECSDGDNDCIAQKYQQESNSDTAHLSALQTAKDVDEYLKDIKQQSMKNTKKSIQKQPNDKPQSSKKQRGGGGHGISKSFRSAVALRRVNAV